MKIAFPFLKLLLCAVLFFIVQIAVAQTTSYNADAQGKVYRKVSGDSLLLRTRAKSKSGVKKGTAKIDSLQYIEKSPPIFRWGLKSKYLVHFCTSLI